MISITAKQVKPLISSMFDLTKPTMPRAFNVLEGVNRGQILVDDLARPNQAVVRETTYGTLYFGGHVDAELVQSTVQNFREIGEVGIGCWLGDPLNDMIPSDPGYDGRTLYFTERSPVASPQVRLPEGYTLAVRDRELFRQSFDYDSTVSAFSTEDNVLKHTLGVVVLHEDKVVCEAGTGAPTHGRIEVGVTTHEAHRNLGLASIACAPLIEMCEAKGYQTWWDCAKQNTPSVKLARKLGYQQEQEYRYVWWPAIQG
jgi:RimJ/RimL family protein N-acetyltransferase